MSRAGINIEEIEKVTGPLREYKKETSLLPAGVKFEEKANFWKIEGRYGAKLYIAKQKIVRQIDFSGFGAGWPGTVKPKRHNGGVEAHLDLALDDAMATLKDIIEKLPDLKPTGDKEGKGTRAVAKKDGASPAAKKADGKPAVAVVAKADPAAEIAALEKRINLFEKVAMTKKKDALESGKDEAAAQKAYDDALSASPAYQASVKRLLELTAAATDEQLDAAESASILETAVDADVMVVHQPAEGVPGPSEPTVE